MTDDFIYVLTDRGPIRGRNGGALPNPYGENTPVPTNPPGIPVSAKKLEQGMADFLQTMGRVIKNAQARATELGNMELDEIELSVEVNGEGQLSLLGSGTKVGGSGAMTLHFKKKSSS
ncbi:hypothetical protein PN498_09065 [Oscillatoria sp. CS-180]|uniref:Pepco domain-containing protein n=1 Tax=Oscillatoria sp. CS-180 TaxID=3021720 RepID=UPI00232EA9A2|nr:hypothetical protein [Oscillatoria sp. CS-180]MDB9526134.1 hypothetical protein [Oscillatoria sp. CS-180]